MPEYRRAAFKGGTYFFTVNTFRRRPILTDVRCRAALRAAIELTRTELPFEIVAWVLLPDHLHTVWRLPVGDANFALRWSLLKRHVTRTCRDGLPAQPLSDSRRKRREGTFWQRRYWEHLIRDDTDLLRHVDYVHYNPVKHGYVTRAIDWPHSTFHRYVANGIYSAGWGGGLEPEGGEFGE